MRKYGETTQTQRALIDIIAGIHTELFWIHVHVSGLLGIILRVGDSF